MLKVSELVSIDRIKVFENIDKETVLNELIVLMSESGAVKNPEDFKKSVFERENIMSTSIGLGIAIPHVRLDSITEMIMAVGVCPNGIDYNAFDDQSVKIIIMIAAPEGTQRQYLSLLAKIALLLKNSTIRESIILSKTPEEIFNILKEH
jgi:nitrogen PTS system EIIA component